MKKIIKKLIISVLIVATLLSMLCITMVVNASNLGLQELQSKFPNKSYWNHTAKTGHAYAGNEIKALGPCNNPDGVTWQPCYSHSANAPIGYSDCNTFAGASQCCGFARKLAYDAYGEYCYNWKTTNSLNDIKPGDVIHYTGANADPVHGHWVFVTNVSGNTLTVGQCNLPPNLCQIRWDLTLDKNAIAGTATVYVAPYKLKDSGESKETTRINNGTYYLKNVATGLYMTLGNGIDANEQNVHAYKFVGSNAQKMFTWHLGENRYAIRPEGVASRIINANAWNIVSGTNVNLFDDSDDPTQHWYFEKSGNAYIIHNVANYNCVIAVDSDLNVIVENNSGKNNQKWVLECVTHTFDIDSDTSCNVCSYVRVINQSAECKHSYDDNGYCKICKEGFPMQVTTTFPVEYKVIKNDTPVRNRPYASDKIVNQLSKNTIVTVVKSGLNAQNNLWHGLDDGTWVYSENLEKVTTEIVLKIGNKNAAVNGNTIQNDVAPELRNSRTMLPIRFVAEQLGATVDWDSKNSTVIIKGKSIDIKIPVGAKKATVNGKSKDLDSPAYIENGRTFTPLRFIAEALGAIVEWNGTSQTVTITK